MYRADKDVYELFVPQAEIGINLHISHVELPAELGLSGRMRSVFMNWRIIVIASSRPHLSRSLVKCFC